MVDSFSSRRVPGTGVCDYLGGLRLARARASQTVAEVLDDGGALYRRFWEPFAVAVMNTDPNEASAALLWPVVRETLGRGGAAYRPRVARVGLSETFIDPAIALLRKGGGTVSFGHRVRGLAFEGDRVSGIDFGDHQLAVDEEDSVILAVPAGICATLLPEVVVPTEFRAILNVHFRHPGVKGEPVVMGLIGGMAQWLFCREGVVSVTISAADGVIDLPADIIASRVWGEISRVLGWADTARPPFRVIKEKRATFAQTPAQIARRPGVQTRWRNLMLAGDWTDTGIPATIEGAIRSGVRAAKTVMAYYVGS